MKLHTLAIAIGFALVSTTAGALTFNVTYDSSVSSAPTGFTTAFQDAINLYQNTFSNPITINLNVGWGEVAGSTISSGVLGSSSTSIVLESYSKVSSALNTINSTYTLPISTTTGNVAVTQANAAALNIKTGISLSHTDGSVGFSSSVSWSFASTSTAVSGQYSFIGVAEHEISEVMGRQSFLGQTIPNYPNLQSVQDLYRYTAPGVLATTAGSGYFSTDGGKTSINTFNGNTNVGDLGDWAITSLTTGDSFNYLATQNQALPFSAGDLTMMKALGYTVVTAVPEADSYAMLLAGLGLMSFMVRRRKTA